MPAASMAASPRRCSSSDTSVSLASNPGQAHRWRRPHHGRGPRRIRGSGGHLPAVFCREGVRAGARRPRRSGHLPGIPGSAPRRLLRMCPHPRAGRPHRRQRGQSRSPSLPVAVGRRDRHSPGRSPPSAAGRDHLAEAAGVLRILRVGQLSKGRQPGPPGSHRAGDRGQQRAVRPGGQRQGPGPRRACRSSPP